MPPPAFGFAVSKEQYPDLRAPRRVTSRGYRPALRKAVRPAAIARAAVACQRGEVTSRASAALRMLAHSMNTLGMVERLVPARSLRGWMPSIPS